MKSQINKKPIFISVVLIVALGLAVYSNSLNGKFIRDDRFLIKDNTYIKSWSKILNCFSGNIALGGGGKWNSYRPLQMITYMIDYSIWGLDVKGYHLTNTLLHLLVALSIYWLINILYDDRLISLLASLLFLVNPLHTGAVVYISGRADSLATVFMLLCFIFYIKGLHKHSASSYVLMLLSYILALLSRESSLILPALLLLYHYSFKKKLKINSLLSLAVIAFIYILVRVTALRPLLSNIPYTTTLFERIPGFFVAITNYTRLLLLPFNLHTAYGLKLFNAGDPRAISGILISAFLLIYAYRRRNTDSLTFFSIYWCFIALLPQSNIYPINAYMAEHWLYLPSIGFFLILAKVLSSIYKSKQFRIFALVFIIILLTFYSYLTIRQNKYWREPIPFYKRTLRYVPDDFGEYNNLGLAYKDIGKYEEAIASFKKAIEINPNFLDASYNLGKAYYNTGRIEESITSFKKSIKINPDYAGAYNNLALAYRDIGKYEEAIASFKKATEIEPEYTDAYYNLAATYYYAGKIKEAIASYKKIVEVNPDDAEVHYNLAVVYYYEKQYALASKHCNRAIALGYNIPSKLLEALKPYRKK